MKRFFQKISSLLLASLVLISTFSFTVEKHYCGRFLVDVSVYSKAKDCGMDMMDHDDSSDDHVKKKSCCKDEIVVLEGQDELKVSFDQLEFSDQLFITSFFYSFADLFLFAKERSIYSKRVFSSRKV